MVSHSNPLPDTFEANGDVSDEVYPVASCIAVDYGSLSSESVYIMELG
ncbi:hypothetical protein N7326_07440 [Corynebacterium sp. ES2794-CONJ1]|nr:MULTISPECIES: hypothetical protein [unclassified Corynebacterium]MCS4532338.1 hypothetical protein [Corynebacterium sp. ES2730-CONJ]MCU9519699.1 hypothetical protein [Corynebacterium sp. ES2794-CONJ1]